MSCLGHRLSMRPRIAPRVHASVWIDAASRPCRDATRDHSAQPAGSDLISLISGLFALRLVM
jgi:hypothetical protein